MGVKITNNASGTLAAAITSGATTLTLTSGQGALFPTLGVGDYCWCTLVDTSNNVEIIKVTARSTDTLTMTRGQDNTTAQAFAISDRLELRPTAALFAEFADPAMGGDLTGTASNAQIAANAVGLAEMAGGTDGNLITYDASGDPAYVTTGSSGQVLTSGGTGVAPTFQAAAGGGKVLQVVGALGNSSTYLNNSWTDIASSSITITPSATTSKILLFWNSGGQAEGNTGDISLKVNSSEDGDLVVRNRYSYSATSTHTPMPLAVTHLDNPNSISAITYKLIMKTSTTTYIFMNSYTGTNSFQVVAMEIGA